MADFLFVPGAGCGPWHWRLLEREMRVRGHAAVTADLPCDDPSAGLEDYADSAVAALSGLGPQSGRRPPVVVAHSFGGLTGPLVGRRVGIGMLVMLAAMVPAVGERGRDWWTATGYERYMEEAGGGGDPFFHDLSEEQAAEAARRWRPQSDTPAREPWPGGLPDAPVRALAFADDRFFPVGFLRGHVRERLGIGVQEVGGGHFGMLSRPAGLAACLEALAAEAG
ncbi:alpha/beta fold hydrolase [Nocardiopsis halophila]|uniref:alpha/beta fold hydrolase n=1 Tax=Nocardiopsis halophila TaxID=141692 RepID=UPI000349E7BA|nr:alpha/beta hydrolase [Nocardiopsis halophila]